MPLTNSSASLRAYGVGISHISQQVRDLCHVNRAEGLKTPHQPEFACLLTVEFAAKVDRLLRCFGFRYFVNESQCQFSLVFRWQAACELLRKAASGIHIAEELILAVGCELAPLPELAARFWLLDCATDVLTRARTMARDNSRAKGVRIKFPSGVSALNLHL